MDIIFQHLHDEVYACLRLKKYGNNEVVFPQNFVPVPGIKYKNLTIKETLTGIFHFGGQVYNVTRAYHPDYDLEGDPINTTASIIDEIDLMIKNKKIKLSNPFAKLAEIKNKLPQL